MRFDDSLGTVLTGLAKGAITPDAAWRQLVDLVAQGREGPRLDDAIAALDMLRAEVVPEVRAAIAESYARYPVSPRLVVAFAGDRLAVAAPLLRNAQLSSDAWLDLLPRLGASQRALLRHRRDLPSEVQRALAGFGASDMIVEAPAQDTNPAETAVFEPILEPLIPDPAVATEPEMLAKREASPPEAEPDATTDPKLGEGAQIRELLERIESFRQHRGEPSPAPVAFDEDGFSFETDDAGTIIWIEGVPRGPLIGATIALPAEIGEPGVDGQAAGAFRRRAPFRSARMSVAGSSAAGGDWRISGVPFFETRSGRFNGYRGSARRPRRDEVATEADAPGLFGGGLSPDSLRQLVHELRTPLNAIQGFADMIESQMLGPASSSYRARAGDIAGQARRLLGAVEDLDTAARIETDRLAEDERGQADGVALLCRLHAEYLPLAREHDVELRFALAERLPALSLSPAAAERMFARLLAAAIGMARPGEAIVTEFDQDRVSPGQLRLTISLPKVLEGIGQAELLDPGYSPAGDWPDAPVLGLGFALRLVSNLARASGGRLIVHDEQFALNLPAVTAAVHDRQSG